MESETQVKHAMMAMQFEATGEITDVKLNLGGYAQVDQLQQQMFELIYAETARDSILHLLFVMTGTLIMETDDPQREKQRVDSNAVPTLQH